MNQFALDVRCGLTQSPQKELPSKYLYDAIGSTLFEAVTLLPEYGLTRADERLLRQHAGEIIGRLPSPLIVAELGSGSGRKTRWILEALARREFALYYAIDVSGAGLAECVNQLGSLDSVRVVGLEATYFEGLREVVERRPDGENLLVLFLGSTFGNFDPPGQAHFLAEARSLLSPGDAMLLGTDLGKPEPVLIDAYDDATGITAAFNLNLLGRINRELRADFDLRCFQHEARYNADERRIEMHLRSQADQRVTIAEAELVCELSRGETIWTESSHKFDVDEVEAMAEEAGFSCAGQWVDEEWPFAESLFVVE